MTHDVVYWIDVSAIFSVTEGIDRDVGDAVIYISVSDYDVASTISVAWLNYHLGTLLGGCSRVPFELPRTHLLFQLDQC